MSRDETKLCGAKLRGKTRRCKNYAMHNGRCRLHGGLTPSGAASPNFKHGRYSAYMPNGLLDKYQTAMTDEARLELEAEIALIDTRLADLVSSVDSGTSDIWQHLLKAKGQLDAARQANQPQQIAEQILVIGRLITTGADAAGSWEQIVTLVEQRRRLVESERKRRIEAEQMVSVAQLNAVLAAVLSALRKHVDDRNTLTAIAAELRPILVHDVSGRAGPVGHA